MTRERTRRIVLKVVAICLVGLVGSTVAGCGQPLVPEPTWAPPEPTAPPPTEAPEAQYTAMAAMTVIASADRDGVTPPPDAVTAVAQWAAWEAKRSAKLTAQAQLTVEPTEAPKPIEQTEEPEPSIEPTEMPKPTREPTEAPRVTVSPTEEPKPTLESTEAPKPTETPPPTVEPKPPEIGDTRTRPADGMTMVFVPAGEFLMGSSDEDIAEVLAGCSACRGEWYQNEKPQHLVYVDAFWIDTTEVTNAQYLQCMSAGACAETRCWDSDEFSAPDLPVVCVGWQHAQAYAQWVGGRLPTEAEWEKAARGTDGRIYPWGNMPPDCSTANSVECMEKPDSVGSYAEGASPYGALDMAGNVWEWVADWYHEDYYSISPPSNPEGPRSGDLRVLRGGSFFVDRGTLHSAVRLGLDPSDADHGIGDFGFRLVVDQ